MDLMPEEAELLPKLQALVEVYEAAMRMADALDRESEIKSLARRQGYLMAYIATIRPQAQDTTQAMF